MFCWDGGRGLPSGSVAVSWYAKEAGRRLASCSRSYCGFARTSTLGEQRDQGGRCNALLWLVPQGQIRARKINFSKAGAPIYTQFSGTLKLVRFLKLRP